MFFLFVKMYIVPTPLWMKEWNKNLPVSWYLQWWLYWGPHLRLSSRLTPHLQRVWSRAQGWIQPLGRLWWLPGRVLSTIWGGVWPTRFFLLSCSRSSFAEAEPWCYALLRTLSWSLQYHRGWFLFLVKLFSAVESTVMAVPITAVKLVHSLRLRVETVDGKFRDRTEKTSDKLK